MQENSQLRESLCWSHTPKGAVWLINNHCPALPRRWSPREPEKSLLQGTKIQRGVQPLGESQSQDEKPGPAHCPPAAALGGFQLHRGTGCSHRPAPSIQPGQFTHVQAPSGGTAPGGHHVGHQWPLCARPGGALACHPSLCGPSLYGGLDQNTSDMVLCFSRLPPTPRPKRSLGRGPSHSRREASGGTGPSPGLQGERGEEARLISHPLPDAGQAPGSSGPSSVPRLQNSVITQAAGQWGGGDRQQRVLREPQRRQALPESTPRHALPPGPAGASPLPTRSRTPACGPVGKGAHGAASGGCARPERCPPQLQGPSGSKSTRGWPSHGCPCCDRQH